MVEGARTSFLGGHDTSTARWGAGLTVVPAVLGWAFGCGGSTESPADGWDSWDGWYPKGVTRRVLVTPLSLPGPSVRSG